MPIRHLAILVAGCSVAGYAWLATPNGRADESKADTVKQVTAFSDYAEAYREARLRGQMLVVYFQNPSRTGAADPFESKVLADREIQKKLERYAFVRIPTSATGIVKGKSIRLLSHVGFAEMQGCAGIAIIDLRDSKKSQYGRVVSVYPQKAGRTLGRSVFSAMLDLPPGSLTQRTLILAVRLHPENPASADSRLSGLLASETESHARYQAEIGVQGHQDWDSRFQRINSQLGGMTSQEVCAESWPGQDLVDAAFECVHSWRQSPGHWSAVQSRNSLFGFDMKRGNNGIWYGTGIFARR